MIVLLLAWALGAVIADVGTAQFLAGSLQARRDTLEMRRRYAGDAPEMRARSAEVAVRMIGRAVRAGGAACVVSTRAHLAHLLRGLVCHRSGRR